VKKAYLILIGGMALTSSVGAAQWSQWDPSVGNGHFYAVTDTALTWYDARAEAGVLGGYLTSIGSLEELNFVRTTFGRSELFWTGLSTVNGNQAFEWDSGEPVGFTYFGAHQPDAGQLGSVIINNLNSRGFTRGFFMDVSPLELHRGIVERNTDPNAQTGGEDPGGPPTQQVPDGGSSLFLLGAGVLLTGLVGRSRR
jgi:hypothetical protein